MYGAHQFLLHPLFVALAWWKLFGFPKDIRLWVAFFVHDIGYWGCPNMDGYEGQRHPELGAYLMGKLFGQEWASFTARHSRSYAKLERLPVSGLCAADKLVMAIEPRCLYCLRVRLTGEWREYAEVGGYGDDFDAWYSHTREVLREQAHDIADQIRYGTGDLHTAMTPNG